jgi:hypothetical protein
VRADRDSTRTTPTVTVSRMASTGPSPALVARLRVRKVAAGTTGPLTWPDIALLIGHRRVDALVGRLKELTAAQRAALVPELERYAAALDRSLLDARTWDGDVHVDAAALAVCAAAVLPHAAAVAQLLTRKGLRDALPSVDPQLMIRVVRERRVPWLGALGLRLAERLDRRTGPFGWPLAAELIRAGGVAWPTHDLFVTGWVANQVAPYGGPLRPVVLPPLDRLRADPCLGPLLPRVFEVEGLCGRLGDTMMPAPDAAGEPVTFGAAIAALVAEGRVDRTAVLDGALARLLRGDRPGAARAVGALLSALEPTAEEVAQRAQECCRLLVESPSPVAARAQRWLRAADDAGRLDPELFLRTTRVVLGRPEHQLVRAQVLWLDRFARRYPERAAEIRETAAVALSHPSLTLQDRVRVLIARLSPQPRPRPVASPGEIVPPPVVDALPAPPSDAPPPPISSPDEVAEEVVALRFAPLTSLSLERLLEALVRFRATAPDALAAALRGIREDRPDGYSAADARTCLGAVIDAAVDGRRHEWVANRFRNWELVRDSDAVACTVPQRLVVLRLLEVALRLRGAPVPMLVSTPTSANGTLDPSVLHERLVRAAREGWEPWRCDLRQAFLRLPRSGVPRMSTVDSDAGRALAAWRDDGGLPDPEPTRVVATRRERRHEDRPWIDWEFDRLPTRRVRIALRPPGRHNPAGLLTVTPPERLERLEYTGDVQLWPAVAPAHRETIAAHLIPWVAGTADVDQKGDLPVLPLLAECTGPTGPAMSLALAYGLAARWPADRIAATDAVLMLAATGSLDAAALGADLADLIVHGPVKANRIEAALGELVQGGAPGVAWSVLRAMLPALLTGPVPRAPAGLMALSATAAGACGAQPGDDIPGLAALVAGYRPGRLATEARRLYALIGPL